MRRYTVVFFVIAAGAPAVFAAEKGLTEQTGQEILKELKAIREALEKRPVAAPQARIAQPSLPQRVNIPVQGGSVLGSATAPLTIVEYTDYQCPFCKRFIDNAFPEIKKNYIDTGKVRFVSRNLPLPFHKNARKAAQAALCAGDQGKYWEMRGELFNNSQALEPEKLPGYAQGLKLDMKKFESCLASNEHLDKIDEDSKEAQSIGLSGTPTFVLGRSVQDGLMDGEKVVGAQPYAAFETKIDELLKKGKN